VELSRSILGLSDEFSFDIFVYDCSIRRWAGSLRQASDATKADAVAWVFGLRTGGGTGTGPAVSLALGERKNTLVVLLSDGRPNCGSTDHREMIRNNNAQGAVIHTFAIGGRGIEFMRGVADDSGGVCREVN
jgi:hypothetical protein